MVYTPLTLKAMKLAYAAHHGQQDKSGAPYIFHPIHLAESMDDALSCCVALLHDTVEDTYVTMEDIRREFPPEVADAVALLTHDDAVDYFDYVRAIAKNPIARKVKLADLAHNADQTRMAGSGVSQEKMAKLRQKYKIARLILEGETHNE